MQLEISDRAAADIRAIADYTLRNWGEQQADRYIGGLTSFLDMMIVTGEHGRATPGAPPGIERLKYESHFIFFERKPDRLLIARVLHERMDFVRHLD